MDDLVAFLRAHLGEDAERTRNLLAHAQGTVLMLKDPRHLGKFIPGWHDWPDVERMCTERLAEIEAKRRILDELLISEDRHIEATCWIIAKNVLRLLALSYADRPGYRQEWRPA